MPLTNVTRRPITDVAGVLDIPLKLVTIKSLKSFDENRSGSCMNNEYRTNS